MSYSDVTEFNAHGEQLGSFVSRYAANRRGWRSHVRLVSKVKSSNLSKNVKKLTTFLCYLIIFVIFSGLIFF